MQHLLLAHKQTHVWLTRHAAAQARNAGTLDAQVPSLRSRRLLIESLDLVPARFSVRNAVEHVIATGAAA
jgi:hypothetical protein